MLSIAAFGRDPVRESFDRSHLVQMRTNRDYTGWYYPWIHFESSSAVRNKCKFEVSQLEKSCPDTRRKR